MKLDSGINTVITIRQMARNSVLGSLAESSVEKALHFHETRGLLGELGAQEFWAHNAWSARFAPILLV